MSQPRKTAKEIFLLALDVESAQRAALLDDACGGDAGLRQQVEALLQVHDEPDSLLDSPRINLGGVPADAMDAPSATLDQPMMETVGMRIGPYKLLEEISEGGMGVVYMAEQVEPVERRVAIKIIKPGMDSRQIIARFEAERQALAMMDHPNIAKVLDAGTTDMGRPYFVMELVNGIPVTQFCDEHQLTPRERLKLFIPVCQAVQHAHQKGIIHRDIKPSNVLIALYDNHPVPKVIDFGVAKSLSQRLTEKTMFTSLGQIVGTIDYMSPEQAQRNQLDVDTRTDVYSLGVLLYELLIGDTPFDKHRLRSAAFDELLRIIREEEPQNPSTRLSSSSTLPAIAAKRKTEPAKLSALLRGELDWIVMKALEKDRARRYETASSLAADVEHFLNDDHVSACPPSAAYRFRKFARRNKVAMMTVAIVIVSLVVGLCGTTWQAIRAKRAEQEATAGFSMARTAVDRLMTRVAEEHLLNTPKMEPMRELLLKDALEFYQQMANLRSNDPSVRLDKGIAQSRLGRIYGQLNNRDAAMDAHSTAIDQLRELHQESPRQEEYAAALADALYHFADASRAASYIPGASDNKSLAFAAYDEAISLLEDLVKRNPKVPEYKLTLIEIYRQRSVAQAMWKMGTIEEAIQHLERAETLAAELIRIDGDNPKFRFAYAKALGQRVVISDERADKARQRLNESVKILEELVDDYPEIAEYRKLLAKTLWNSLNEFPPDPRHEVKQRQRVVELYEQLVVDFPSITEYRANLSGARMHLGNGYKRNEQPQAAEEQFRVAEDILLKLRNEYPEFADYKNRMGWVYRNRGGLYLSERQYEAVVQVTDLAIDDFPDGVLFYYLRGLSLFELGRYEEALAALSRALEVNPNDANSNGVMHWLLVAGPSGIRDPERVATVFETVNPALRVRPEYLGDPERVAGVVAPGVSHGFYVGWTILGAAYYRLGQLERARTALLSAGQHKPPEWDYSEHLLGQSYLFLAMSCGQAERYEEAYEWFAKAEAWIEEKSGPEDVHVQNLLGETATVLTELAARTVMPEDNGPDDLDPDRNQVLVAQEPALFEIWLHSPQQHSDAAAQWQSLTITRDGRPLQAGVEYDLRYDPAQQTLAVAPSSGVFEDGVYRVSIPQTITATQTTRSNLTISVCSHLPKPQRLSLEYGRDGYMSGQCQHYEPLELVPRGAAWQYLDDGSDQGVAWRELEFDDTQWKTGRAQLGYGDDDEATVIGFGPDDGNKYPTAYFRHIFQVADPNQIHLLQLELLRDDGAAVYLNGTEIARDNLPPDASYDTFAPQHVADDAESVYLSCRANPRLLLPGDNCLAVEVHQDGATSSDVSFDLRLSSPPLATIVFDDLLGSGARHIPTEAVITHATLRFSASNSLPLDVILTRPAVASDGIGIGRFPPNRLAKVAFDVKHNVQAWCDGGPNQGWIVTAEDYTSNLDGLDDTPQLVLGFVAPEELAPIAWYLANSADTELRDPNTALQYAQRAIKALPEDIDSRTALGAALYRNGQYDEAITALKGLERESANERALLILAMAHAESGRLEIAREILAQVSETRESTGLPDEDLPHILAEAKRVLHSAEQRSENRNTQSTD